MSSRIVAVSDSSCIKLEVEATRPDTGRFLDFLVSQPHSVIIKIDEPRNTVSPNEPSVPIFLYSCFVFGQTRTLARAFGRFFVRDHLEVAQVSSSAQCDPFTATRVRSFVRAEPIFKVTSFGINAIAAGLSNLVPLLDD